MMILANKISKLIKSQVYRLIKTLKILILQMAEMMVKMNKSKPAIIKKKPIMQKLTQVMLIIKLNKLHKKQMDKLKQQGQMKNKWRKVKFKMGNNKPQMIIIQRKEWNKMQKVIMLKTLLNRLKNLLMKFNKKMIRKITRLQILLNLRLEMTKQKMINQ